MKKMGKRKWEEVEEVQEKGEKKSEQKDEMEEDVVGWDRSFFGLHNFLVGWDKVILPHLNFEWGEIIPSRPT